MKRRKRNPVKVRSTAIGFKISKWCKLHYNDETLFNIPILCEELGLNPDSRKDYNKVYNEIKIQRNGLILLYKKWKKLGKLKGMNCYVAWNIMLKNYNQNDKYVFLSKYDKKIKCNYYIQPSFYELEEMDRNRLNNQWKGIISVMDEMKTVGAQLVLSDGKREPVENLLKAGKKVDNLLK